MGNLLKQKTFLKYLKEYILNREIKRIGITATNKRLCTIWASINGPSAFGNANQL
jgi:hypothetical protein